MRRHLRRAGLRDGEGALERGGRSVVKRVCLHPVPLLPEGSQAAGHRINPGKKRPELTRHPPARLRKRRQDDGMETDRGAARVALAEQVRHKCSPNASAMLGTSRGMVFPFDQ